MPNVFIEPSPDGGFQIETPDDAPPHRGFVTQEDAVAAARQYGYKPLVARSDALKDKDEPDHWREA